MSGQSNQRLGGSWQPNSDNNPNGLQHQQYLRPQPEDEPSSSSVLPSSSAASSSFSSLPSTSFPASAFRAHSTFHSQINNTRSQFPDSYGISGSHAEASHLAYQPSASSYERPSVSNGGHYQQQVNSGNEVRLQGFNTIQRSVESFVAAQNQVVASNSVSQSGGYPVHQAILEAENCVMAIQEMMPPEVDSTVGQSGMVTPSRRQDGSEARHTTHRQILLHSSSGGQSFLSSLPPSYSQSEVTTSGGSPALVSHHGDGDIGQGHGEAEIVQGHGSRGENHPGDGMESAVSSISDMEASARGPAKRPGHGRPADDLDLPGEPDTTQEDDDEYQPSGQSYLRNSAGLDGNMTLTSSNLGVSGTQPQPSSSHMADSVMDGDQLSSTQLMIGRHQVPTYQMLTGQMSSLHPTHMTQPQTSHMQPRIGMSTPFISAMSAPSMSSNQMAPHSLPTPLGQVPHLVANQIASSMMTSIIDPTSSSMNYVIDSVVNASTSMEEEPTSEVSASKATHTEQRNRRKSSRIAMEESETTVWRKPKYTPKVYNPSHLWCEECMTTYEMECPIHKLVSLPDKIVFSRAWASLPQALQIFRLGDSEENVELGVFAKRAITKNTQFGPLVADLVDDQDMVASDRLPIMVERPDGHKQYYEKSDENKCNWMMFVRPAETYAEMNLVAYQHGQDIYFTVTKTIEVKNELKVWYAAHYAERLGKRPLEITEEDIQAMEEQLCKFQCYECPKRFKTASALQKHLSVHDTENQRPSTSGESSFPSDSDTRMKKKKIASTQNFLRKLQAAKKIKDMTSVDNTAAGSSGIYHWKKRSTNIYLNKTLKKYQKRHDAEVMRKSVLSMYRKSGKDAEGSEWVCNSCDLTFDNSNLLNLHTLTHAAEDVGLDEVKKFTYQGETDMQIADGFQNGESNVVSMDQEFLACPVCQLLFTNKKELIEHAAEHGRSKSKIMTMRPYKCGQCWKSFANMERLQKHQMCHGDDEMKPLQCHVCFKRFMNNSALACHMKTHSTNKYYECPICHMGFDQTTAMREHSLIHANAEGLFNCPHCDKCFAEFLVLKKHVRGFHTNRYYPCNVCDKTFPRPDKLRLHMLRHSSVREFMCDTCGRQFKRKDKLKEHIKRMHSAEREEKDRLKALRVNPKKFVPKVAPTEFHRFIYKCQQCMLGFKRRGMLVNHIAKKHPDIKPESVPELNLPILKTQRDYYCQYCDKVYKSSSKRKAHILKNHPGAELPQSSRKKSLLDDIPGVPNPTYSQTVGSITTMPHQCEHCHKQYASKAKLLQHMRKKHNEILTLAERQKRDSGNVEIIHQIQEVGQATTEEATVQIIETEGPPQDASQASDLLTQAMSELTQSLQEYRPVATTANSATILPEGTFLSARIGGGPPTMVQIQTANSNQGAIELTHLTQAIQAFAPPQGHLPIEVQVSGPNQISIPLLGQPGTSLVTVNQSPGSPPSSSHGQPITFQPINIVPGQYISSKNWTNFAYKQT